jgi:signal transduction histidine kinase
MKFIEWRWKKKLDQLLAAMRPGHEPQARRIVAMQLDIVLPAKAGVIAIVLYYLFYSGWLPGVTTTPGVVLETLQRYFIVYTLCNVLATVILLQWRRFPPGIFQWLVFTLGILDGLFVAGLALITGGFESTAFWVFPGLIVLNALSIPLATPQIVLNLLLSAFYLSAGLLNANIEEPQINWIFSPGRSAPKSSMALPATNPPARGPAASSNPDLARRPRRPIGWTDSGSMLIRHGELGGQAEPFLFRLIVLWLLTACCYGVQALLERQRASMEEAREFELRERQLRSAGRLAAEFAHQIKNPLAIINNAAFSIRRALKEGRNDVAKQIEIIQEEVERSDTIVTQIMGYAQLTESHVEKLTVTEELEAAIGKVFPPAAEYGVRVERNYELPLPSLLMQRRHFAEVLLNLLQNAREALDGKGIVEVTARRLPDDSVEIVVADNGPGIPANKLERIFEAYYTTKKKGTGLGLAIVKHNLELYAGTVRAESELGKGARFRLILPAKAVIRPTEPI